MLMGIDSIKANLTSPARTYNWEVLIPPIVGIDTVSMLVRCDSTQIPSRTFDDIHIDYKQTAGFNVPGKPTYTHNWDCTFKEGEDAIIWDSIYAWQQAITHNRLGIGVGDPFIKADLLLSLLTTTGATYKQLYLIGAYPSAIGQVDLSMKGSGNIVYPVTFKFDYVEDLRIEAGISINVSF